MYTIMRDPCRVCPSIKIIMEDGSTLSRVSNTPYLYILYATLRVWKLETLILRGGIGVVPSGPLARAHLSYK
jgi:hypothetical protein